MHKPTLLHWQAVKRLFRYLKHTIQFRLQLFCSSCTNIQAYCDADWLAPMMTVVLQEAIVCFWARI